MRHDRAVAYEPRGEVVGGGYFVFRRGRMSQRVHPGPLPFEHPTLAAAMAEADRLAARFPGAVFCVFAQVDSAVVPVTAPTDAEIAARLAGGDRRTEIDF